MSRLAPPSAPPGVGLPPPLPHELPQSRTSGQPDPDVSSQTWGWALLAGAAGLVAVVGGVYVYRARYSRAPKPKEEASTAPSAADDVAAATSRGAAPVGTSEAGAATAPPRQCDNCGAEGGKLLRCGSCKSVYYCSGSCQQVGWKTHKAECKRLQAAAQGGARGAEDVKADLEVALKKRFQDSVKNFLGGGTKEAVKELEVVCAEAETAGGLHELVIEGNRMLGYGYDRTGDLSRAQECLQKGCRVAVEQGRKDLEAACHIALGLMMRRAGRITDAVASLDVALQLSQECGDRAQEASAVSNMACIVLVGDKAAGMKHFEAALALRKEVIKEAAERKDTRAMCHAMLEHNTTLANYAGGLAAVGDHVKAEELYNAAMAGAQSTGELDKLTACLLNLANMCEVDVDWEADPGARERAKMYRLKLLAIAKDRLRREIPDVCSVCLVPMPVARDSPPDGKLILLQCFHCFHDACFKTWCETNPSCPDCRAPVTLL